MPLFHKNFAALLRKHIKELDSLGLLPELWKWRKEGSVKPLKKVIGELIHDLDELYVKHENERPQNFDSLISSLNTLLGDLNQIMMQQKNFTGAEQRRKAKLVNDLVLTVKRALEDCRVDPALKRKRINRLNNVVKELRVLLEKNYPTRAHLFDIGFEQARYEKHISPDSRNYPMYHVFLKSRANPKKKYIVIQLLKPDVDMKVTLANLRSEYQLQGLLQDAMKKVIADDIPKDDIEMLKKKVFHEVLAAAAANSGEELYSDATFQNAYDNILFKKTGWMQHDNTVLLKTINQIRPDLDNHQLNLIIDRVRAEYYLEHEIAEKIYLQICELILEDLKLRKNKGEVIHWTSEVKKAAGSDDILHKAIRQTEQHAAADEEKIRWLAFLFRDRLKVKLRYGRFPDYAFAKLEERIKPKWRKDGFEP